MLAPNSLLEVLGHISIIIAFPGGKSGLGAQGIPWPVLGAKREQPSWDPGEGGDAVSIPWGGGRGTLLMARSSQKRESSWFEKTELS